MKKIIFILLMLSLTLALPPIVGVKEYKGLYAVNAEVNEQNGVIRIYDDNISMFYDITYKEKIDNMSDAWKKLFKNHYKYNAFLQEFDDKDFSIIVFKDSIYLIEQR